MWQRIINVQEDTFLTWLRDKWREHSAGSRSLALSFSSILTHDNFQGVNGSMLHGGNAIVDAIMLKERRHMDRIEEFKELYGLSFDQIEAIGNVAPINYHHNFPIIEDAKHFISTLNVLNAVGCFHLEVVYLTPGEKRIFKKVVKLVLDKKHTGAEEVAKIFPFVRKAVDWSITTTSAA